MKLVARQSRREVTITLCIWAVLMIAAIAALVLLQRSSARIIEQIHYVNVSRVAKANVLYAEAEKHATQVFERAEDLNAESEKKVLVPAGNVHYQKAVSLFDEAQKLDQRPEFDPDRRIYYEMQGQLYDAAGNTEKQLLSHARAFISRGDFLNALDNIREAQAITTGSVEPVLLLAQLRDEQGSSTEALAILQEAQTSITLTPEANWVLGALHLKAGDLESAITAFRTAVEGEPENLTYRRELAIALKIAGKPKEATEVLRIGLNHGAWLDAAYLHVYGEYLVDVGELNEAIRILKQADELAPYSGDVQWSLAKAYHKAGQARQSAATLRRATEIRPELQNQIF